MKIPIQRRDGITQRYNFSGKSRVKTFKVNDRAEIRAQSQDTRSGFRHVAALYVDGHIIDEAKVTYQNRTWESYEFESVIKQLLDQTDALDQDEKKEFLARGGKEAHEEVERKFKTVANVAAMGELFGQTQAEKNAWKLRMFKAGHPGLSIPEDWDDLSEDEKESRLNKLIEFSKRDRS